MSESPQALDHWGRIPDAVPEIYRAAYDKWFRVSWEGTEHLPREGGALLMA